MVIQCRFPRNPKNLQCKLDQASRGAKQQRTKVDARMVGQFFRAYAAWVAQARVLQAGQDDMLWLRKVAGCKFEQLL